MPGQSQSGQFNPVARSKFVPQGLVRDLPPWETDPNIWNFVQNMVFRRGLAQRGSKGQEVFGTPADPPVFLHSQITRALNSWVYAADDGITQSWHVTDGTDHKTITPAGFAPWEAEANAITAGSLGGVPIYNWKTQSVSWNRDFTTPGVMTDLPGAPTCAAMRTHNNRIIAINTEDDISGLFPNTDATLIWSSLPKNPSSPPQDLPEADDWIPAIDNSAGNAQLSGFGPLIDGHSLRGSFVVYSHDGAFILDEIGGSFVFNIRKLSQTTGVLSRNCIASFPGGHLVLSPDDVFVTDGSAFTSVIDNVIKREIYVNMGDNFQNCFVVHYASRAEIWVCTPVGGDIYPSVAYIFDTGTRKWGIRELPQIPFAATGPIPFSATFPTVWSAKSGTDLWSTEDPLRWSQAVEVSVADGLILADANETGNTASRFVSMDNLIPGDPAALFGEATCEVQDLDLDRPDRLKTLLRIWPRIDGTAGDVIEVRVGTRNTLDSSAPLTSNTANFTIGATDSLDLTVLGRYISVRFRQTQAGDGYIVSGFDLEYVVSSRF